MREEAITLFANGDYDSEIARKLGIDTGTVWRWHKLGLPRDWEAERRRYQEQATRHTADVLARDRAQLARRHFQDLENLRSIWGLALFERGADGKPLRDSNGNPVPKRSLTPQEIRALAQSYTVVQAGQRLIYGQDAYQIAVSTPTGSAGIPDIPMDMVKALEAALVQANSDPGDKLDDEEDD